MSWDGYIDSLKAAGIPRAAIFSRAGDSTWAQSAGFTVSAPEIQEIAQGFDNPSKLQANGVHIQGTKYFTLKVDDRSIYAKHEQEGVIAVRTKLAIIVAYYNASIQPGAATSATEKLADYLIGVGY